MSRVSQSSVIVSVRFVFVIFCGVGQRSKTHSRTRIQGQKEEKVDKMATKDDPTEDSDEVPSFYEEEENLKVLCNFLRSNDGPPVREAIEMEKRVQYLKGELL